ncbi:hypothetical protein GW17_00055580 [Ensete ventricosum]|nr:hypothetical protein GW17_00055580 [Ensete ventricosum]
MRCGHSSPLDRVASSVCLLRTHRAYQSPAHEKRDSEQDECEVGYSPRAEEAQSSKPTGKRSHKERFTMVKTRLDVLEASLEEPYQRQRRLLGVESSQEEAKSRIDRIEFLVDRLTEDTKDSIQHLHEVVVELMSKVMLLTRTLNTGGQRRLLGVESSQEEAKSRLDRIEFLVDRLTEDTKDSVQHLHEVVVELTSKVMLLTMTLNTGGNNTHAAPP